MSLSRRKMLKRAAAAGGVRIENSSSSDPLVILKHFGPGNPDNPRA